MIARAAATWLPGGVATDVVVEHEGSQITAVRRATSSDPPAADGLLIPGTINAHLHLELSALAGQIPANQRGFPDWATRLQACPRPTEPPQEAAARLFAAGVAAVGDVSSRGDTAGVLTAAGLTGVVWKEFLGFDPSRAEAAIEAATQLDTADGAFRVRPAAHAIFSTPPALLAAALAKRAVPATIHLAEDPSEEEFLAGEGVWPEILDQMGIDWRWWAPPGGTPVDYLASLGLIRSDVLVVHGVWLSDRDRATLAAAGSTVVLCPRSNLHIGGRLADIPALLRAGVRLAFGTDSLASCDSLDPLDEIPVVAAAFPHVDAGVWLALATSRGADALGLARHGRIAPGATPGLLLLEGIRRPEDLATPSIPRRWLAPPLSAWGHAC